MHLVPILTTSWKFLANFRSKHTMDDSEAAALLVVHVYAQKSGKIRHAVFTTKKVYFPSLQPNSHLI